VQPLPAVHLLASRSSFPQPSRRPNPGTDSVGIDKSFRNHPYYFRFLLISVKITFWKTEIIMKRIAVICALACFLTGCGGGTKTATPVTSGNPTPPPTTSNLVGSWSGTITGQNFSGTAQLNMIFCYQNSSGPCEPSNGTLVLESTNIQINCGGNAPGNSTSIPLTVNGTQFSGAGSGSDAQVPGGWTLSISGNENGSGVGSTMSGNMSFSSGPCGTAANPWTGTFTATWQHG
jgi:hypothetical protein